MVGFAKAIEGQALPRLPEYLVEQLRQLDDPPLALRVRLGDEAALGQALSAISNQAKPARERVELIRAVGDADLDRLKTTLLGLMQSESDAEVTAAALVALQRFSDPPLGQAVADRLAKLPTAARPSAISFLASREQWSGALLESIESGRLAKGEVATTLVEVLLSHGGKVAARTKAAWPSAGQSSVTGRATEIARVRSAIRAISASSST